ACAGETIVLSVPQYSGSALSYVWTTPNGTTNISGLNTNELIISPLDEAVHEGNYNIVVTVDGCVLTSADYNVVAFDAPVLAPMVSLPDSCSGGSIELSAGTSSPSPLTYQWAGPNGFVSSLANPTINNIDVSYNGTYVLQVSNSSGCLATASVVVDNIQSTGEVPSIDSNSPICFGDTIRLSTSSSGDTFEWIQNSDSQSSLALPGMTTNVDHTIIPPGHPLYENGPWRVRVISANGCNEESAVTNVLINEVPVALAENTGPVCLGSTVQLNANTLTDAVYRWYDGDPNGVPAGNLISMIQNPVINNLSAGNHDFYLIVEQAACAALPVMTTATVNAAPTLSPSASYVLASNCAPADITLNANATGSGLTYAWSGPNNFSSTIENPTIPNATTANNGTYTLQITDDNACSAIASVEITNIVNAVPMPIINHDGPECVGNEIVLSVPQYQGTAVDYIWTTPAGTTSDITGLNTNQIVISPTNSTLHQGEYSVEITVDGCVINSDTFDLDVHSSPTLSPSVALGPICEGEELELFANASNAVSYQWVGPNGFSSTAQNPTIANAAPSSNGTYTVVVSSDRGCTSTASVVVDHIVRQPVRPSISSNQAVCADQSIELSIQEQYTGTIITYNWTNGAGTTIGTASMLSIDADDANAISPYRVRVTVDGCSSDLSVAAPVLVTALPEAIPTNGGAICPGESAQLFANPVSAGAIYQWTLSGSTTIISTAQNPIFSNLTATTTYELTVINNGCISNPVAQTTVVVNTPPSVSPGAAYTLNPDCSASDLNLSANATVGSGVIGTYQWSGPNGFSSSQINPTLANATSAANGSYQLVITDAKGC
ncbi:MAG: hypothetical protein AAGD05_11440, partial [Bacteroidota bacterium]